MKPSFVFVASCIATVVSAATIAQTTGSTMKLIMNGLTKIEHQFTKLDTAIGRFPKTGVKGANDIHEHEATIHTLFGDLNNNLAILPRPVSQENVKRIVDLYQSFTPTIVHTLNGITAKAPAFVALSAAATMSQDLVNSASQCAPVTGQIESITPPVMTEAVSSMFNAIDVARQSASAAFQ